MASYLPGQLKDSPHSFFILADGQSFQVRAPGGDAQQGCAQQGCPGPEPVGGSSPSGVVGSVHGRGGASLVADVVAAGFELISAIHDASLPDGFSSFLHYLHWLTAFVDKDREVTSLKEALAATTQSMPPTRSHPSTHHARTTQTRTFIVGGLAQFSRQAEKSAPKIGQKLAENAIFGTF